ncbi:hypothetical protein MTO96_005719 [Rhipicephalus appendiculatus]
MQDYEARSVPFAYKSDKRLDLNGLISGKVRKAELKVWLDNLCQSPLYIRYNVLVLGGPIDKDLNDLAKADDMGTAEEPEDDDAAVHDPMGLPNSVYYWVLRKTVVYAMIR